MQRLLKPILVNGLDEPVAAVWISDDARRRWYVLPAELDWETILDWLQQQALPEFVPGALRRARSPRFFDPDLLSRREVRAAEGLRDMEARHAEERREYEEELAAAKESADGMRHGLLYESGTPLAKAVQEVLRAADLHVIDLDDELGATRSADLLVGASVNGHPRCLVEIKGAGGAASEKLVQALEGHMRTWPQLRPNQPLAGGVLVVNHQHKMDPAERSQQVYQRKEFVDSLSVTVLSTRQLYDWWREDNWAAIGEALFGAQAVAAPSNHTIHGAAGGAPPDAPLAPKKKRGWCFFT
ncbi:MAG: hypothetical protein PGN11_04015 [Quadrisphaera sp.]